MAVWWLNRANTLANRTSVTIQLHHYGFMLKKNHLWSQPLWTHHMTAALRHTTHPDNAAITGLHPQQPETSQHSWPQSIHLHQHKSESQSEDTGTWMTHQGQGRHVGTPSVCRRAAAWDPRRCTRAHPDWPTRWHATWSHNVASEMHIDEFLDWYEAHCWW